MASNIFQGRYVLEQLLNRLECGYIKQNSKTDRTDKSLAYVVRDLANINNKVIPFFNDRLIVKRDAFEKFKKVMNIVSHRRHLTYEGIRTIIEIAYSMNTQKRRVSKEEILKAYLD